MIAVIGVFQWETITPINVKTALLPYGRGEFLDFNDKFLKKI